MYDFCSICGGYIEKESVVFGVCRECYIENIYWPRANERLEEEMRKHKEREKEKARRINQLEIFCEVCGDRIKYDSLFGDDFFYGWQHLDGEPLSSYPYPHTAKPLRNRRKSNV